MSAVVFELVTWATPGSRNHVRLNGCVDELRAAGLRTTLPTDWAEFEQHGRLQLLVLDPARRFTAFEVNALTRDVVRAAGFYWRLVLLGDQ